VVARSKRATVTESTPSKGSAMSIRRTCRHIWGSRRQWERAGIVRARCWARIYKSRRQDGTARWLGGNPKGGRSLAAKESTAIEKTRHRKVRVVARLLAGRSARGAAIHDRVKGERRDQHRSPAPSVYEGADSREPRNIGKASLPAVNMPSDQDRRSEMQGLGTLAGI